MADSFILRNNSSNLDIYGITPLNVLVTDVPTPSPLNLVFINFSLLQFMVVT